MDAKGQTDLGLVEQRRVELQRSYQESGELLVRALASRLRRQARRRGLDLEAAREVVQQAFTELFAKRPKLRNLEAWLVRVVDRRSIDWIRRAATAKRLESSLKAEETPAAPSLDLRLAIEKALRGLPERQRQLVRLRYLEGYDEKTAAARTGYSPASVKKMLTRALRRLREVLGDHATPSRGTGGRRQRATEEAGEPADA